MSRCILMFFILVLFVWLFEIDTVGAENEKLEASNSDPKIRIRRRAKYCIRTKSKKRCSRNSSCCSRNCVNSRCRHAKISITTNAGDECIMRRFDCSTNEACCSGNCMEGACDGFPTSSRLPTCPLNGMCNNEDTTDKSVCLETQCKSNWCDPMSKQCKCPNDDRFNCS